MKQKKKMLLAMAALSAVAVGVGTTSTFAWFKTTTAVTVTNAAANGTVSVVKNSDATDSNLTATIHLIIGTATSDVVNVTSLTLTEWDTGSNQTVTPADRTALHTATKDAASTYTRDLAAGEASYLAFPLSAWIEDTVAQASQTDLSKAQWESKIDNSTSKATYTFSWDSTYSGSGDNVALAKAEVFFYLNSDNTSYAQASEKVSTDTEPDGHKKEITVGDFIRPASGTEGQQGYIPALNAFSHTSTAPSDKLDLGYLLVRIDGVAGNYDHNTSKNYSTRIAATGNAAFSA